MQPISTQNKTDALLRATLGTAAVISVAAVLAIFTFLAYFSIPLFTVDGAREILNWDWRPLQGAYGILPMIIGSLALSTAAMVLAFPTAVLVCAFGYGVGPTWLARLVMAVVHFMTGIPTIVYAFVAVVTISPLLRRVFETGSGFSLLAAAVTLATLVLPTIVLIIDSHWQGVAPHTKMTCSALGMSSSRQIFGVLVRISRAGLLSAFVLGYGRALGDTMIALLLSGNAPLVPTTPLESVRTLTAHIGLVLATEVGGPAYRSVFASGLILLLLTGTISALVRRSAAGVSGDA